VSDGVKNIFISHVHEDDEIVQDLRDLLKKKGHDVRDSSIDSSKPNEAENESYIKSGILAPNIRWASTVVVLISPETHASEWVNWEIEYAENQGKRIVGVWVRGAQQADLPEALEIYADAIVGWQGDRVMDAITGTIENWIQPDGHERAARSIPRYSC
jgi:hypothetical protein